MSDIVNQSAIEVVTKGDRLVVDSRLIALDLDIQHKNFAETIRKHKTVTEQRFGTLTFETASSKMPDGRINPNPEKFYWLTEAQASFLMTLSRNTDRVIECKANLVQAFMEAQSKLVSQSVPRSYAQALLEAGRLALELEKAEAEKLLLEEQNEQLSEAVDELFDYSSIIRIAKFNNVCETRFKWQTLKGMSRKMGCEVKRVPCPRFEWKNLYSHDVWRICYPDMQLPETTTLVIKH
jgi:phage regulator Rha-like protein